MKYSLLPLLFHFADVVNFEGSSILYVESFIVLQDILSRTKANQSLNWYKSLQEYYFRPEWELFDLKVDGEEKYNVAQKTSYQVSLTLIEYKTKAKVVSFQ